MVEKEPLYLVTMTLDRREQLLAMMKDYQRAGESRYDDVLPEVEANFAGYVEQLERKERGLDLPPGHVPSTTFWLVRGDTGEIIGSSRLRHRLNELLENEGGNIGYDVRPSERGKGYATRMLAMMLDKARELGLSRVLITCDTDNVASARVIQKNGGRFVDEVIGRTDGQWVSRYWIDL